MTRQLLRELEGVVRGDVGFRRWASFVLDPQLPPRSIDGRGEAIVDGAIKCLIVGLAAEGRELLGKADAWLAAALSLLGPSARFLPRLALWAWLSGAPHNPADPAQHAELLKEYLAKWATNQATWDFVLPRLVDLGESEFCVEWCREQWPSHQPAPATARQFGPAGMAYLLALQLTRPALSDAEMVATQHEFLTRLVPEFLARGLPEYLAFWAKLLTQAEAGQPAQDAVRTMALRYCPE